jgi:c-di-GMP-binding flagellar brake protein YcgR
MTKNKLFYTSGYQKDNIDMTAIKKAISDIQYMDDEHGAFWVSVVVEDYENVIEANKSLTIWIQMEDESYDFQAPNWDEVQTLYELLLAGKFDEIKTIVK